ncbi:MAG: twin-arginine translocation signal domain-containing protein [Alphaproteobacteria bacterium]
MERRTFLKGATATAALSISTTGITMNAEAKTPSMGPLLDPWVGPHSGLPRFDRVRKQDFKPALM